MKKLIYIAFLLYGLDSFAQDNRTIFIGRYAGIAKQSTSSFTAYDYHSVANIRYGDSTLQFVNFSDSCSWALNWTDATGIQQAQADSTVIEWGSPNYIHGKLYPNDSLYYQYSDWFPPSSFIIYEFFGFKLYSTVGKKGLEKPENKLLLSPQPASDVLYVQSTQIAFDRQKPPVLYDVKGERLNLLFEFINNNTYRADVSELDAGVYFILFYTAEGPVKKKLLVQH